MEPGEVFPSLTVDINSPTPYTDATQVRDTMIHTTMNIMLRPSQKSNAIHSWFVIFSEWVPYI